MLSNICKLISHPRFSSSILNQQYSLSSKSNSSSRSTGDTYENDKKDIHNPKIDASHQSGTKTIQERQEWIIKEQGFSSDIETRQERIPVNEKKKTTKK